MSGGAAPAEEPAEEDAGVHRRARSRKAAWTTITAIGGRGLGMLLSLVTVPLTIGFLDKERYGAWITIGSMLTWFTIADLGLGAGLQNALSVAHAKDDRADAKEAVSTSMLLVAGVAAALALVFAVAFPFVGWHRVLAVSDAVGRDELRLTVIVCGAAFLAGFPLGLVEKIYVGYQEGYVSNYWAMGSNVLTVAALVAVVRVGSGLPWLALALSVTPLLVRFANTVYLFARERPWLAPSFSAVRLARARPLLAKGGAFLVAQLAALAMWQNDNIIIAQLFGAREVGPYAVAFRLATTYVGLVSMWLSPFWPAYAEAGARGDRPWIEATLRRTVRLATGASAAAAVGLVLLGGFVIRIWTRSAEMVPDRSLLLPIGIYIVVINWCNAHSMAMNGLGRVERLMVYGLVAAGINVALSIVLGKLVGVAGVCWATDISALIPAVGVYLDMRRILREPLPAAA
jgi:O-antigen/teichoic acid export membrane protein